MAGMIYITASVAKTILIFIDPKNTPKIAYDDDSLLEPLIEKVKGALGEKDGSQQVIVNFNEKEKEIERQFAGVCKNIFEVFKAVHHCTKHALYETAG
jgi:hypothetical protein